MSIDFLYDLERAVNTGKVIFACPGSSYKQWFISKDLKEIQKQARRQAVARKAAVQIVRLMPANDAVQGEMFLVPTQVEDEGGGRGEPQIKWATVETKEAATNLRDLRYGPSPFFAMQYEEEVNPNL